MNVAEFPQSVLNAIELLCATAEQEALPLADRRKLADAFARP